MIYERGVVSLNNVSNGILVNVTLPYEIFSADIFDTIRYNRPRYHSMAISQNLYSLTFNSLVGNNDTIQMLNLLKIQGEKINNIINDYPIHYIHLGCQATMNQISLVINDCYTIVNKITVNMPTMEHVRKETFDLTMETLRNTFGSILKSFRGAYSQEASDALRNIPSISHEYRFPARLIPVKNISSELHILILAEHAIQLVESPNDPPTMRMLLSVHEIHTISRQRIAQESTTSYVYNENMLS